MATQALVPLKHAVAMAAQKAAFALKKTMLQPMRLFRRQALSPLELLQEHPAGFLTGLKSLFHEGGLKRAAGQAMGPYVANYVSNVHVSDIHDGQILAATAH